MNVFNNVSAPYIEPENSRGYTVIGTIVVAT